MKQNKPFESLQTAEIMQIITGKDPVVCTKCNKGKLVAHPVSKVLHFDPG